MFLARFGPLNRERSFVCVQLGSVSFGGDLLWYFVCSYFKKIYIVVVRVIVYRKWTLTQTVEYMVLRHIPATVQVLLWGYGDCNYVDIIQRKTGKKKNFLEDCNCRVDQSAVLRVAARYVPKHGCHYPFPCGAYRRSNYDHNGEIIIIVIFFLARSKGYMTILRTE